MPPPATVRAAPPALGWRATAWLPHNRHVVLVCAACAVLCVACVALAVWGWTRTSSQFAPNFEMTPIDPGDILACSASDGTFWAQTGGDAGGKCIFSGDMTVATGKSEADIQKLCSGRADCAGYLRRQVQSYDTFTADNGSTQTVSMTYNFGQPEYVLLPASATGALTPVSTALQGPLHQMRTVVMKRLS